MMGRGLVHQTHTLIARPNQLFRHFLDDEPQNKTFLDDDAVPGIVAACREMRLRGSRAKTMC